MNDDDCFNDGEVEIEDSDEDDKLCLDGCTSTNQTGPSKKCDGLINCQNSEHQRKDLDSCCCSEGAKLDTSHMAQLAFSQSCKPNHKMAQSNVRRGIKRHNQDKVKIPNKKSRVEWSPDPDRDKRQVHISSVEGQSGSGQMAVDGRQEDFWLKTSISGSDVSLNTECTILGPRGAKRRLGF